jgi:intracellular multiplication protein IcmP
MTMRPYPNPRASWPSSDDTAAFNLFVIIVGLCVGAYLLWDTYHTQISAAVMAVMHHEIVFIDRFTDRYALADRQMAQSDPSGVTLRDLYGILHAVGMFFRIPATALLAILALICVVHATPSRFKRRFDLDRLIREQARMFPVIAPFVARHLGVVAPPNGVPRPADYALTPQEWIKCCAQDAQGRFNRARAEAALVTQLGPGWMGPAAAPPVARLLFVVFALHLTERRDDAMALLVIAAKDLPQPEEDAPAGPERPLELPAAVVEQADAALADPAEFVEAKTIAGRHAYTAPALMALLNAARLRAGVLAPAQFAWLKLVDRALWYSLHSLGYETEGYGRYLHPNPRPEAGGARDHWAAERAAGEPVIRPSVERALEAIQRAADEAGRPATL